MFFVVIHFAFCLYFCFCFFLFLVLLLLVLLCSCSIVQREPLELGCALSKHESKVFFVIIYLFLFLILILFTFVLLLLLLLLLLLVYRKTAACQCRCCRAPTRGTRGCDSDPRPSPARCPSTWPANSVSPPLTQSHSHRSHIATSTTHTSPQPPLTHRHSHHFTHRRERQPTLSGPIQRRRGGFAPVCGCPRRWARRADGARHTHPARCADAWMSRLSLPSPSVTSRPCISCSASRPLRASATARRVMWLGPQPASGSPRCTAGSSSRARSYALRVPRGPRRLTLSAHRRSHVRGPRRATGSLFI